MAIRLNDGYTVKATMPGEDLEIEYRVPTGAEIGQLHKREMDANGMIAPTPYVLKWLERFMTSWSFQVNHNAENIGKLPTHALVWLISTLANTDQPADESGN